MELETAKETIKETIIKHDFVRPECVDELVDKIVDWYKTNQRKLKAKDFTAICKPYLKQRE